METQIAAKIQILFLEIVPNILRKCQDIAENADPHKDITKNCQGSAQTCWGTPKNVRTTLEMPGCD